MVARNLSGAECRTNWSNMILRKLGKLVVGAGLAALTLTLLSHVALSQYGVTGFTYGTNIAKIEAAAASFGADGTQWKRTINYGCREAGSEPVPLMLQIWEGAEQVAGQDTRVLYSSDTSLGFLGPVGAFTTQGPARPKFLPSFINALGPGVSNEPKARCERVSTKGDGILAMLHQAMWASPETLSMKSDMGTSIEFLKDGLGIKDLPADQRPSFTAIVSEADFAGGMRATLETVVKSATPWTSVRLWTKDGEQGAVHTYMQTDNQKLTVAWTKTPHGAHIRLSAF